MNKLLISLGIGTGLVLVVLISFLAGSAWNRSATETTKAEAPIKAGDPPVSSTKMPNPPPPPSPLLDEVRVRESLKPGRTYLINTRMTFSMRGTDKDWHVVTSTVTVNYAANAEIERKIVSNDGRTIVEERTFKKVQSGKVETDLESFRIDLGATGDFLLGGIAILQPEALLAATSAKNIIEKNDLSKLFKATGLAQSFVDDVVQRDPRMRAITSAGSLQGKTVRLTYTNDAKGEVRVEAVKESLSVDEQRFLASSVLLADSLIFPDMGVKKGEKWQADGLYFIGLIDPSLMARTEGQVELMRGPDKKLPAASGQKQECVQISVVGGELNFHESNAKAEQIGFFRPQEGEMVFSPQDQIFIQGHLKGRGKLTIKSKDHILFEARSDREPELTIHYTCKLLPEEGK